MQLILTHEQADFDALAAVLAAHLLDEKAIPVLPRRMNRNVQAFLTLYGAELPFVEARDLPNEPIERVTLVDTQSLVTLKGMSARTRVHIVDHHQTRPDLPADWTMSGERMGACTTLLVENLHEKNGDLETVEASLLLLGIYEDTGSLTYASTTPRDVRAAAALLEMGASLRIAAEFLNPPLSAAQRAVYDRLLQSAQSLHVQSQSILIACTQAEELNEEISSIAHKLRDLLDPDALFLIIQTVEGLRLVARSTSDQVNVATVAVHFGGGGHERAAAALIKEPFFFAVPAGGSPLEAACQALREYLPQAIIPAITVGQIMSHQPIVLDPTTPAQQALAKMQRYGFEGFPVVRDGKVIGLLTRRAVDRAIAHKLNLTAASLMEAGAVSALPGDSVDHLQRLMTTSGWGQVPVLDPHSGKVIGIVTRTDLLKTLALGREKLPGRVNLAERIDATLPEAQLVLLKAVAAQAHELHQAAFIVGGVVRDLVLGRPGQDFDMVVEGDAIALGRALCARYGGRIVAHSRFGTAKWWIAEQRERLAADLESSHLLNPQDFPESLDLISARTEFYEYPTALPTVERSSIKLDLHRRDFTINTMAVRLDGRHYGDLHDYWGGWNDLRQGLVRVLHSLSFVDDPTRMLRAVRFEQRFGFQIEERTRQLMEDARPMMRQVSGERLRHELDLMLAEQNFAAMFKRLQELDLLHAIHPDLEWNPAIAGQVQAALNAQLGREWDLPAQVSHIPLGRALAYVTWFASLPAEKALAITELLRLPAALLESVRSLHRLEALLAELPPLRPSQVVDRLEDASRLAVTAAWLRSSDAAVRAIIARYMTEWRLVQPVTGGSDLRLRGLPPGPAYRRLLAGLRRAWLDGEVTTPAAEQALLDQLIKELGSEVQI